MNFNGVIPCVLLVSSFALAEEGLFAPHQIESLPNKKETISSVVRVRPLIKFKINVFDNEKDKQEYEKRPGAKDKEFLPQGGVIWPVIITKTEIETICAEPNEHLKPGNFEICGVYQAQCTNFPCSTQTGFLKDSATGFFISDKGHFLTNYHVARECIERLGRTNGSEVAEVCPDVEVEVPELVQNSLNPIYLPAKGKVWILRNLSATEWKNGNDFALLKIDYSSKYFLQIDRSLVISAQRVWLVGFPAITRRDPGQLMALGYNDADNSLRISTGLITDISSASSFQSNADGVHGNSGSPTIAANGLCVGIMRHGTPETKYRPTRFAGEAISARTAEAWRLLRLNDLQ